MALLPANRSGISPGARHLVPMLQVDDAHSRLSVWLGTQICLGRPYPSYARPIALLFSRDFRVRSQGQTSVLVMVADCLPM